MSSADVRKTILHIWKWLIIEAAAGDRLGYVQYYPWIEDNALYIVQIELKSGVGYLNLMPGVLHGLWKIAQAMPAYRNDKNQELKAINLETWTHTSRLPRLAGK